MNRRNFLSGISTFGLYSLFNTKSLLAKTNAKVLIIGAGWGGLSAAKTIKTLSPNTEVIIIERERIFISCPISNWVIGQIKTMKDITFGYEKIVHNYGIKLIHDEVVNIDIYKKTIKTRNLNLDYDKLILSPGVELDYSKIENWKHEYLRIFPSAWKAGSETQLLSENIKNMNNGSIVGLSIPLSPYRCPPGPYERISLIASYIKNNKPNSKIIVLDANQNIISKAKLFKAAWDDLYKNIIEYRTDSRVVSVNAKAKILSTDFDDIKVDVANLIPPQKAPSLLKNSGLINANESWASVNALDFSSTLVEDVFVIGDATSQVSVGKVPKSGYVANSMGKVCGLAVLAELKGNKKLSPSMINTCFSLVSSNEGISVSAVYRYDEKLKKIVSIKEATGLSPSRSFEVKNYAWDWAQSIWSDLLT